MSDFFYLRLLSVSLVALLAACSQSGGRTTTDMQSTNLVASAPVAGCLSATAHMTEDQQNDPRYWLQLMVCVQQQSTADNFRQSEQVIADSWAHSFLHNILLSGADITDQQRQQMLDQMSAWQPQVSAGVRPLLQLWRDNLSSQLNASRTELKYQQLRQSSDNEMAALRVQQQQLQQELSDKRQQLQRLADIERQLSNRKPVDLQESSHLHSSAVAGGQEKETN
ncbi:hypothetical protein [Tatumella citrea]|uniref:Two-component system QseEF-associated lipoprotein QseG n=1 Tax=Tatumella citrea TaxID=53336 RepID=A0A1Y0LLN8_TATCI|nr:hypothetical protein [Tatumella citrea]ARU94935.1 hypothetical protein A7K98_14935 [Tatumella citrea]ARU98973.1 hypothetical protein A7K99_14920 [Tatumella citrea]